MSLRLPEEPKDAGDGDFHEPDVPYVVRICRFDRENATESADRLYRLWYDESDPPMLNGCLSSYFYLRTGTPEWWRLVRLMVGTNVLDSLVGYYVTVVFGDYEHEGTWVRQVKSLKLTE